MRLPGIVGELRAKLDKCCNNFRIWARVLPESGQKTRGGAPVPD